MSSETLPSVAVIGCGHWGKNLVRKFHELGALKAISDPSAATAKSISETYDVPSRGVEELLGDDAIDALVIAAPAHLHHEIAMKGFAAGKHIYVEKPIALSIEDAEEMIAASRETGKTLMVGHLLQYHPVFLKLKDMVANGDLGKLRYVYSRRLNIGKLRTEENVLWSFAPHDISMMLALAGEEPSRVDGMAGNYLQTGISDFATVHMTFPSGLKGHVETSWLNPFKEQRLVVVGKDAMAEFDDQVAWEDKLKIYRHKAEIKDGLPVLEKAEAERVTVAQDEPLLNECRHFLDFIQTGQKPFTDGAEALAVLKVLRAGDQALAA